MEEINEIEKEKEIEVDLPFDQLNHKNADLKNQCAEFISKGWKFIEKTSLDIKTPYNLATFNRIHQISEKEAFLIIFK